MVVSIIGRIISISQEEYKQHPGVSNNYNAWTYFIQLFSAFCVVVCKQPHDCFTCFNRLGKRRNYSMYQYPVEERIYDTYSRLLRE